MDDRVRECLQDILEQAFEAQDFTAGMTFEIYQADRKTQAAWNENLKLSAKRSTGFTVQMKNCWSGFETIGALFLFGTFWLTGTIPLKTALSGALLKMT
jgi:hypothetical protein